MELNANQLAAVNHFDGPCCVIAGAGSGKTAVLVARVNALLNRGARPQRILAITFSQKAVGEMRERIFLRPSAQKVCISTFHALGLSILRNSGYTEDRTLMREYQKIRPLDGQEYLELKLRLQYPEKFWKLANHYFASNKAWLPKKNTEKLFLLKEQQKAKADFLKMLE